MMIALFTYITCFRSRPHRSTFKACVYEGGRDKWTKHRAIAMGEIINHFEYNCDSSL